jgi:hypothetical protein
MKWAPPTIYAIGGAPYPPSSYYCRLTKQFPLLNLSRHCLAEAKCTMKHLKVSRRRKFWPLLGQAFVLLLTPTSSWASGIATSGHITQITPTNGGIVYLLLDVKASGSPSCSTSGQWIFDASTQSGQALLGAVYTAFAQGLPIWVTGTGSCNIDPTTESVAWINVRPQT